MDDVDWVGIAEKAAYAVVILIVTWILAKVIKWAISKLVSRIPVFKRQGADGQAAGESLGQIGSLLVWLFGLVAVLQIFTLNAVLSPVQRLLENVMDYLPNVVGAALIFFIGLIIAKIAKQLIETTISMVNFNSIGAKVRQAGPSSASAGQHESESAETSETTEIDGQKIGSMVGNLVFAVIIIVLGIAALQVLGISAISQPAEQMLTMILNAIPGIIAAVIILGIGYLIANFIGPVLESTLRGMGTDRVVSSMGIMRPGNSASVIINRVAQIAIMVFFAVMAARALDFPEITRIFNEILALGGHVLFGGVIIAAGFVIAKIVAAAVGDGVISTVVRYATIALFVAMGLKYMGIADSIITLAFGSIVVGGALAAALAFGLGGREAASRVLAEMDQKRNRPQ